MNTTNNSRPTAAQELIDFCLRQLGEPVVKVNVDPFQCNDCLEMALQVWREFHYDASERMYLKEFITPSVITLDDSSDANVFQVGEVITGSNSNITAMVHSIGDTITLNVKNVSGEFEVGETLTGSKTSNTAIFDSVEIGSFDKRYFDADETILSVIRVLPLTQRAIGAYMWDIRYQFFLNAMPTLTTFNLDYYVQLQTHLSLINDVLYGVKPIRHSRHMNRIYLDFDWHQDVTIGDYIIFEVWQYIDENVFSDVYNDYMLKKYLTALIKKQWGTNLKKFSGIQMPGGTMLNGSDIYQEALREEKEAYEEMKTTYSLPAMFYVE